MIQSAVTTRPLKKLEIFSKMDDRNKFQAQLREFESTRLIQAYILTM